MRLSYRFNALLNKNMYSTYLNITHYYFHNEEKKRK